jgi:hypothetical protein
MAGAPGARRQDLPTTRDNVVGNLPAKVIVANVPEWDYFRIADIHI